MQPNEMEHDDMCKEKSIPPRLYSAHSASIDGKFDKEFGNMYVTLHGSWNRVPATGYKVIQIPFNKTKDDSSDPVAE
jgi:glucose/arabinose dehydrogenase